MGTTIISAKLAKRIIAKISELVGSSIEEKVKGHIETKRTELFIKNYQKKLEEELLEDYGNEIIYDELWDILSQDKNIEKLLERCYNLASDDKLTDEEFVNDIMKSFKISIYNRESIKRILIQISKKAFESFNELRDPENIKLKNCVIKEIHENRYQIIKLQNNMERTIEDKENLSRDVHEIKDGVQQILLSQEEGNRIINTGTLSEEDIELIQDGNYSIKLAAKTQEDYFCISTKIKVKLSEFNFDSFEEFISYLRFTGKQAEFEVYHMRIENHNGKIIKEYKDENYKDFSINLPLVYVREVELNKFNFQSMRVLIKPQFDYIKLQLENEEGDVLVPNKKYKIERENKGDSIVAHMLDEFSDGQLITNFEIEISSTDPLRIVTRIQINQRIQGRVSGTIELYNLLEKIYSSEEVVGRDIEKDRIVMKGSLPNDKETEKCLKETRKFYKKLRKLENDFNVRFNIPETIDEEEITNVFEICDLLEKGVVKTSGGKITIKSDQIQIEQGSIEDLIKQKYIALMYHYQKIEVLNVELPIANFLRIVHFSDDMSLNSDGDIEMNCNRVYAYNEKKATLTEAEIINNLANEKLVITR